MFWAIYLVDLLRKTPLSNLNIFKYSSEDLSDKEKSIVLSLAGYVFSTFSRRLRFTKKNNPEDSSEILQEYLHILAAGKLGDEKQELPGH